MSGTELALAPDKIRISEIFGPTVQGEGALIGMPTVFVRTGGCDFRCSWCDTLYAVDPAFRADWKPMSATEVLDEVAPFRVASRSLSPFRAVTRRSSP